MRLLTLFMVFAVGAFAQLIGGIATSVSRTVTLTADQADFSIVAAGTLDTPQQQITQLFLDAGLPSLTLAGTGLSQNTDYSTNPSTTLTTVLYQFTFSVPAAGLKDAAKLMESLRTKPPTLLKSLQYSASLDASQATVDAIRQTILPQLFSDAQKKGQTLAAAAGLKLGAIQGVTESYYAAGNYTNWIGTSSFGGTFSSSSSNSGTQYTFSANVAFSVTQ